MKNQPEFTLFNCDVESCPPLQEALMPSSDPQPFGAIDFRASLALADKYNLPGSSVDRDKSLTGEPLEPGTVESHDGYLRARTDLGLTELTARRAIRESERTEVHGTHTLPACFSMAEILLEGLPGSVEILKHQISAPIQQNLELVAYTGKNPNLSLPGKQLLYSHLRCEGTDVFVRGFESDNPVRYVYDDSIIPECTLLSIRDLSPQNSSGIKLFQQVMSGLPEAEFSKAVRNPSEAALIALDIATISGKEIIKDPAFGWFRESGFSGLIPKGALFVSRVQNFSLQQPELMIGQELTVYASVDLGKKATLGGVELLPIDFQIHNQSKLAEGTVTVASVPFSRL